MPKVLVIEDDDNLREQLIEFLTLEGYSTIEAEDGLVGVELASRYVPDLILCDIMMPNLDGYGVIMELQSHTTTAMIPFIFLTAKSDYESLRRGMELGADDYIVKPYTREELLNAVRTRLEKKTLQEREFRNLIEAFGEALDQEHEQRLLKGRLISMFTHDFRNSLAVIRSSNNLVRNYGDRMPPERRVAQMDQIETAVRQLLQMLDDLLVVGQMESGHMVASSERFDLAVFFKDIIEEFQLIGGERYTLKLESAAKVPVCSDQKLLRQIVTNLLSNAIKYSPAGGVITVTVENVHPYIKLQVRDQGMGIPEADQPGLFDAFRRASNVGEIQGTGLGLAIVRQAIELLNGHITFESQSGAGTTFIVTLPDQA